MNDAKTPEFLKHYTSIANLHKILSANKLLLSDSEKWDDKNDLASVQAFCKAKGKNVKARVVCFAEGEEMILHWNTYAKLGCRIEFRETELLKKIKKPSFLHNFMKYKPAKEVTSEYLKKLNPNDIPFLKRRPYECEKEFRIIWFGIYKEKQYIGLNKNTIKGITLSPNIKGNKCEKLKSELEKKYGIEVKLSRLLKLDSWISKFNQLEKIFNQRGSK
jgi:hypothetical protein